MSEQVKLAWSVPLSEGFELKEFALGVLEVAKENLQRDLELVPASFAITTNQILCYSVSFANHDEKPKAYSDLIEAARNEGAIALITCNDALVSNYAGAESIAGYYPGKLAIEGAQECIMLIVSGPKIQTWAVEIPYTRINEGIEFGEMCEELGGQVGFLEGWACEETKASDRN
jgi:hypothetical protein